MVARLKKSDVSAFDGIYRQYAPKLYGFALSLIKNQSDAEGVVQEVFLKIWKNRDKLDLHASFESYLFTITHNTVVSLLRKKVSEKKYLEYLHAIQLPPAEDAISADLEWRELQKEVELIIDQLPARQQEVYRLSREQGLSYPEIAQRLELSINTVENHMGRALKFIRSKLKDQHSLKMLLFVALFFS